jgi:RNA polymerase sigma-70 factor (sigma-E family)
MLNVTAATDTADPPAPATETAALDFADFVRDRSTSLLYSAYLMTGDRHLAEDLVQSALARTHRAWKRLHHNGKPEAYTRKVMYHLQVDWWRRRRVAESLVDDLSQHPLAGDSDGDTALRLTVRAALLRLAPRQRAVLVLRYFEQLTIEETAAVLGCATGTVKSQTAKALARLRVLNPDLIDFSTVEGGS